MRDLELRDVYETAARANIHEQFAAAYLHDIRGSMQALFSAIELLSRSAQFGTDPARAEKASELAKRAIANHEKSTMEMFKLLTLEREDTVNVDLNRLLLAVAHFLRNHAASKGIKLSATTTTDLVVAAEKGKLQTHLIGLLAASLDGLPAGAELQVSTIRRQGEAVVTIDSDGGYEEYSRERDAPQRPTDAVRANELTFLFAEQLLSDKGGRLTIEHGSAERPTLNLHYPCVSLAHVLASATEK